ncbi:hypothetical protein KAI65_06005 [Candidatus Parcubacteria bacterium]|nr:hypothetical protein [Candidatus Parcubacteria bacterium]
MDQTLLKLLEEANFTNKEARVYLALLELGQGNVTEIAKITELKRPIIYVVLEGLIKRGHASELPNQKINIYQAIDPSIILNKLQTTTKNFSEMLPVFRTLKSKGKKRPRISYYETLKGIWNVYEEMSRAPKPFFISNYHIIEKYFPNSIDTWINGIKKGLYNPQSRHLAPDHPRNIEIGREFLKIGQEYRISPELKDANMDFTIWYNKLAITSFEDEPFIVVIESEELTKSMLPIFNIAWKMGRKLKKL